MAERKITFNFDEFPTLLRMAQDDVFFKMVIGPTGSAKSSACAVLAFYDACSQAPWTDGVRRTRTVVVRNTFAQLEKNSIPTWRQMLGGVAKFTLGNRPYGRCKLPLPDGTVVDWEIEFLALNSPNVDDDILGMEFTNAVFEEVSQMENQELVLAVASRYGRYPSKLQGGPSKTQIWGNTNGPRKDHWLYDWSLGKKDDIFKQMSEQVGRVYFRLYRQPPGLIEVRKGEYVANPLAENVQNLAAGYGQYFQQLIRGEAAIQAYVMGDFSDLTVGKLVYPQFKRGLHTISYDEFIGWWGKTGYICMTFDFGRTPVCLFAYRKRTGGIVIFDEIMAENSSINGLYLNDIKPVLEQRYPNVRIDFATGDPAGDDGSQNTDVTPYGVLHKHGIPIEFPGESRKDSLDARIEATRQRMMTLDDSGSPLLQITDNCRMLLEALTSTYVYAQVAGKSGVFRDVPTKTHANWSSDLVNSLEYLCLSQVSNTAPRRKTSGLLTVSSFAG
jgi:hypothetical protein